MNMESPDDLAAVAIRSLLSVEEPYLHLVDWDESQIDKVRARLWRSRYLDECVDTYVLRGDRMTTYTDLFEQAQAAWQLPGYFGHNWAALEDCLWTLELHPPRARVTFVTAATTALRTDDRSFEAFVRVLDSVSRHWGNGLDTMVDAAPLPFHVVFQDPDMGKLASRLVRVAAEVEVARLRV